MTGEMVDETVTRLGRPKLMVIGDPRCCDQLQISSPKILLIHMCSKALDHQGKHSDGRREW